MFQRKQSRSQKRRAARQVARKTRVETLEARQVMSADPLGVPALGHHGLLDDGEAPALVHHGAVPELTHHGMGFGLSTGVVEAAPAYDPNADFWLDSNHAISDAELGEQIEQLLNDAHGLTGQDEVVSKYGFDGAGQTVVVIDSGIAHSHTALGGGYGPGYRVVGGWDFTENDADPYDDGPSGAHGTHVAGIVGADGSGVHSGVATGVDLVGLRVFDDAGNGYFSWVESALDWVYANRNAFDNPITAVNLSLGTEWNSHSMPGWAMLEEEFAALEAEGIFISVSAGNSFQNYNTSGVSYPAGSDHVIPVMSVDNDGSLSYFSQRANYAIAAPGRWITSTVPDYAAGDADTIDDDWLSMSGTSMAAPYVAGASVLVREAMEFVGMTDIDQWDLFNHMMSTADEFYDSATSDYYKRLNLEAAIDALMPTDDFGSSVATAHHLGSISESGLQSMNAVSGVISTLDDDDYFTFTAGETGTVTFTVSGETHRLDVDWWGAGWSEDSPGVYSMDVVANQSYTFAVGTTDGLGYYDIGVGFESSFSAVDWGAAGIQDTRDGLAVSGESWFSLTAGVGGLLTAETLASSGSVSLAWFTAEQSLLADGAGSGRVDASVAQGQSVLLRVTGDATGVDLRLTNAVAVDGAAVTVTGTSGDDALSFTAGVSEHSVSVNGVSYAFASEAYASFSLQGGGGSDALVVTGSAANETATLSAGSMTLVGGAASVDGAGFDDVTVYGGGGADRAHLYDTAGVDAFSAWSDRVVMSGDGYTNAAHGFGRTDAYSTAGADRATFYDTAGADTYVGWSDRAVMYGTDYFNKASGFARTDAHSTTGADRAVLHDSAGADTYVAWSTRAVMYGSGFFNNTLGFGLTYAYSTSGADRAVLHDTAGSDSYAAWSDRVVMSGSGYANEANGFGETYAYATEGTDRADLYDTAGDETYTAWSDRVVMSGGGFLNEASGFVRTTAFATGGFDRAIFHDTAGADTYVAWGDRAVMYGSGYFNDTRDFSRTDAHATTGADRAVFFDTAGADTYVAWSDRAVMYGSGYFNDARGFARTFAYGSTGADRAVFKGSDGDDAVNALAWGAYATGESYRNEVRDFERVIASNGGLGDDTVYSEAVDYAFEVSGDWS